MASHSSSEPLPLKAKAFRRMAVVFAAGIAVLVPVFLVFVFFLYQEVEQMVARHYADTAQVLFKEIRDELSVFERTVHDYGYWNDAYQYIQKPNPAFINANFIDESLRSLGVDFVLILGQSNQIVFQKLTHLEGPDRQRFLDAIDRRIAQHTEWTTHPTLAVRKGFEEVGGQVLMVGISPITNTEGSAAPLGTLVFGRFAQRMLHDRFSTSRNRAFTIHPVQGPTIPADLQAALQAMSKTRQPHLTEAGGSMMVCYLLVPDLHGTPCFILRMEEPNILSPLFKGMFWAMFLLILALSATSCVATLRTMGRTATQSEREHQRDMQTLLDGMPAYAFFKDVEGRYVMVNRKFCEAVGRPPTEIVGRDDFTLFPPALAEKRRADDHTVIATGVPLLVEDEMVDGGRVVPVSTRKVPLKDETGAVIGIVGAGFDITERKEAETALRDRTSELVEANRQLMAEITERKKTEEQFRQAQKMEAVGRLAGGVAHDFNNLLLVISGYGELLLREFPEGHPRRRMVLEIKRATERATSLTHQLLAFSRKQVVQPRIVDLNLIIKEIQPMLQRLIGEDIPLVLQCAPALGLVNVDPGQIQQVIMNLAINARDAMPKGGTLTLETRGLDLNDIHLQQIADVPPGTYVALTVRDEGCGMSAEVQSHLFEPFYTTKEPGKGTGLGLSTVYGIVRQASGFIQVKSEVNQGTVFTILLPQAACAVDRTQPAAVEEQTRGGSETLFVVEDEESVRDYVAEVLRANGYQVVLARDGNDAMKQYRERQFQFDLLLSDIVMPGLKGEEIASFFQTLCPHVKIILMSGYTDERITGPAVTQHGFNFLAKPFKPDELLRTIRRVLDHE